MKNIAVILAAGSGKRIGGKIPKQYILLSDGLSVMETTVTAFENAGQIDEIFIVANKEYFDTIRTYSQNRHWQKLQGLIEGGKERWESSLNAIKKIKLHLQNTSEQDCNILLHDCARPFVSQRIITDVCQALKSSAAVTVAIPTTDTIYTCDNNKLIDIPPRRTLLRAQTPQAFRLSVIDKAYHLAEKAGFREATDDCGILHRFIPQIAITIVTGEEENKKITYPQDLENCKSVI